MDAATGEVDVRPRHHLRERLERLQTEVVQRVLQLWIRAAQAGIHLEDVEPVNACRPDGLETLLHERLLRAGDVDVVDEEHGAASKDCRVERRRPVVEQSPAFLDPGIDALAGVVAGPDLVDSGTCGSREAEIRRAKRHVGRKLHGQVLIDLPGHQIGPGRDGEGRGRGDHPVGALRPASHDLAGERQEQARVLAHALAHAELHRRVVLEQREVGIEREPVDDVQRRDRPGRRRHGQSLRERQGRAAARSAAVLKFSPTAIAIVAAS